MLDVKEKQILIKENKWMVDPDKEHGKDLFKSWMEELGEMGRLYWKQWEDTWSGDIFDIVCVWPCMCGGGRKRKRVCVLLCLFDRVLCWLMADQTV